MKKVLLLSVILFASIIGKSQEPSYFETYKTKNGKWNEYKQEFVYSQPVYQKIKIEISGNVISIKDQANSVYITRNKEVVRKTMEDAIYAYDAIDEENRICKVMLSKDKTTFSITILYTDFLIEYFIK